MESRKFGGNDMNATATLTKRESEVAELIAWGASKKEIASTAIYRQPNGRKSRPVYL